MAYAAQRDSLLFLELPTEILVHVLGYLPLPDLYHIRTVCSQLLRLIDNSSYSHSLWNKASLERVSVNQRNIPVIQRAARHGNMEALIKLAIAYLYSEGVPDGKGKGTLNAVNGWKAAEYLILAESQSVHRQPFSWVLIRPPLVGNCVCCKACVCFRMKQHCDTASDEEFVPSLFYIIGKALSFHEEFDVNERIESLKWFERGFQHGSSFSSYEYWKAVHKISQDEVNSIRLLRRIANESDITCMDAKLELCRQYSVGHFGGISRSVAYQYIKQIMQTSPLLLSDKVFHIQHDVTKYMMFILIDWLVEVSEMKEFSTQTVHLAIQLIQRYLMIRRLSCSRVQLLGVTALLIASKWTDMTIITIRESAWLTDDTYKYEQIVNMMGEVLAALKGDIQRPLVSDYLDILTSLSSSDHKTFFLASYIAEATIVYPEFGGLTTACFASSCLLLARILLHQDYPWSYVLIESTGYSVSDLKQCVLLMYKKCFSDEESIIDHRGMKLNAVNTRYAEKRFLCVSQIQVMSFADLKDHLGILNISPSPSPLPSTQKMFSFLSDNQYRSDEDSIVSQSFMDNFSIQCISESLNSSTVHSSPHSSRGSLLPSPISFANTSSISSDITSPSLQERSCTSGSFADQQGGSSSLPLLHGIEPLHSEETVGFNLQLASSTSSGKRKLCRSASSKETSNKENYVVKTKSTNRSIKPLGSLENLPMSSTSEKRSSINTGNSKNKKHRSTTSQFDN